MAMSRAGQKRLTLLLVVLFLGVAGVGAYALKQAQTRRNMARWLEEGTAAYEQGDYPKALELLNKYVSREKTNAEALLDFADTRLHLPLDDGRHLLRARGIVQQALSIEPNSLRGRTMLMEIFVQSGLLTEARDAAERVLQLDTTNLDAHRVRLDVFITTDRQEEAVAAAMRMAEAFPDDLEVQQLAFKALLEVQADPETLKDFLDSRESRFAGTLGLELMRAGFLWQNILQSVPGTPEHTALVEQFHSSMRLALDLPAATPKEAIDLVVFLDIFSATDADRALARFLEDPSLGESLASFAAERAWSQGQFAKAGSLILAHIPDLTTAPLDALGWVALSDLPEANKAQELLRASSAPDAEVWLALAETHRLLASSDPAAADKALPHTLPHSPTLATVTRYLQGKVQSRNGELARAAETWRELLRTSPGWHIARQALAEAYLDLGRPLDARALLAQDRRAGSGELLLRIEIAIDEAGLTRPPPATRDSYQSVVEVFDILPNSTTTLCLAARAALATGRLAEAREFVDQLLAQQPLEASQDIAVLATLLAQLDPERSAALRSATASETVDPATALMLAGADANAGEPEQGLARLQAGLAQAPEEKKLDWELVLAHYRDRLGDPDAADDLLQLSAQHPDNRLVQLTVLKSSSVWRNPETLGPVIQRFRSITGDRGLQWRLYNNKLELALLDRDSDRAVERANSIMFDLVSLIREDPQNVEALDIFAEAAEIAGDDARAAEYLLRAVQADPKNIVRRLKLVNVALPRAGRVEEARHHARALTEYPITDPDLLRERAKTLARFGFHNLARADWEHPSLADDPIARVNLAYILLNADRVDEADALVAQAIASESIPDAALVDAAYYLARRDKIEEGLALFDRLPDDGPLGLRTQLIARYLFRHTKTLDQARSLEARARADDIPAMWAAAVQAYMNIGRFDEARRVTTAGLELHPTAPELTVLAQMFAASDEGDPLAILAFLRSRRSFTETPEADRIVTLFDQRLANEIDDDELLEELEALVAQSPSSFAPREALATAQRVTGRLDDMADTLLAALDAMPTDPAVAGFATSQFNDVGMYEEALFAARQWRSRLGRPDLTVDQTIASLLMMQERPYEALAALDPWQAHITEARMTHPGDAYLLASALAQSDQPDAAMTLLQPLMELPNPGLHYCLMLTPSLGDPNKQREWLALLTPKVMARPHDPQAAFLLNHAWWNLASTTETPEDIRMATQTAETLLTRPDGEQLQIRLAAALGRAKLGEPEQAADHYRAMLAADPTLADIHNNLAYLLLTTTDTGAAEALEHANTAVELAQLNNTTPDQLRAFLDTQALALLANGRAQEAISVFQQTLELDPAWAPGLLGLAEALLATGETLQVREILTTLDTLELSASQAARAEAIRTNLENK